MGSGFAPRGPKAIHPATPATAMTAAIPPTSSAELFRFGATAALVVNGVSATGAPGGRGTLTISVNDDASCVSALGAGKASLGAYSVAASLRPSRTAISPA